jgi:hypothetical protein
MLLTLFLYFAAIVALPEQFLKEGLIKVPFDAYLCSLVGLWGGLLIGYQTEFDLI